MVLTLSINGATAQTFNWKNVNIQGMGFVTGLVIHPDTVNAPNTVYCRTDVGGAYRYDSVNNKWIGILDTMGAPGVDSIALDPNSPNAVYVATTKWWQTGDVFYSSNKGASWASTNLTIAMDPNAPFRGASGERLAVDPNKSGLLYYGSHGNGLWKKDVGGSWAQVTAVPTAAAPGCTFVVFDKSSGTVGGATKNIYVGVWGSGIWRSTDAGATWANIGGGANPCRAAVASNGTVYFTFGTDENSFSPGAVKKYTPGTWVDVSPSSTIPYSGVTVDPTNPNIIMVMQHGGFNFYRSTDAGATWSYIQLVFSNEPAYYTQGAGFTPSWGAAALVIDPNNPSRVWQTQGFGVVKCDNIAASPATFSWTMNGLEELIIETVAVPPLAGGADLLIGAADELGFRVANRDIVPGSKFTSNDTGRGATGIGYCYSLPQNACYVGWDETNGVAYSGYSTNNGQTWTTFGDMSPGAAGTVAMSSTNPQNMVWVPANSAQAKYTTNGGASWTACTGITTSWNTAQNIWVSPHILAADRVNGSKFYMFDNGKFLYSTNGGATWTAGAQNLPTGYVVVSVVANPGVEGDVWIAFHPDGQALIQAYHSTNNGVTFSPVTSMASAALLTFGKGSSATNPYAYILGRVGGATADGVYKSTDMGASWTLVSDPATNTFGSGTWMEGDMRTQDLVYIGTAGRGAFYGQAPAPSAPTGLTATPGNAQAALAWTASPGATSYNAYRGTTAGGESGTAIATGITATTYTNTGLANGTKYYYTVKAVNAGGASGTSNEAGATPVASGGSLGGSVAAVPGTANLTSLGTSDWAHWGLSGVPGWDHKSSGGTQISNYTIVGSGTVATNGFMATTYSWTDGTPTATNAGNTIGDTLSGLNNGFSITAPADTTQRTLTVYAGGYLGTGTLTAHLSDSSSADYVNATQGNPASGYNVAFTLTYKAASAGKTLTVTWKTTTDSSGNGTCNVSLQAATLTVAVAIPAAPTGLAATSGNAQVALSWVASNGATSYSVYRGTAAGGEGATAIATGISSTSYTNTGLTNGTAYFYKVKATNTAGTSGYSNEASAVPVTTITDLLSDWTIVNSKSANWSLDNSNTANFNGDASRAMRTIDDTEYLVYKFNGITTFNAKVYIYTGPVTTAKFYSSGNNGASYQAITVNNGAATVSAGGWSYYNVVPSGALPAGTNALKVEFNTGTGNFWDPELSQISITY